MPSSLQLLEVTGFTATAQGVVPLGSVVVVLLAPSITVTVLATPMLCCR